MNEVRVKSWNELQDKLYQGAWSEPLKRFRPSFAYRGEGNADSDLRSSLVRLSDEAEELEGHMLRNFRKYARRTEVLDDTAWTWLAVAQHYGLPTRLLDWTHSPFVALHFATANTDHFDRDGVIWCVNYAKTNEFLPRKLKKILDEEGSALFTAEMLGRAAKSLEVFDKLSPSEFVLFWEPPSLDDRIVNQFALFSLMSSPVVCLDEWLADRPDCYWRIILPAKLKWEVRDKLDQANVTERVLFPGLDGLCLWLKRYYSPRKE